ncbi:MAG: DUF5777 family beta-barrel protein [Bacteroidota bacterium]|nr:DUF5777 family beta-barrel protein [Bacteroidota bacterium]
MIKLIYMCLIKLFFTVSIFFLSEQMILAQDTSNLMNQLEKEIKQNETSYAAATFKSTRIINGHSVETLPVHVLDVRISHRFGPLSSGIYNFFGLDNATMRLGFDYGITGNIMIGAGHSTFQKTYDAFFKIKILRQSTGKIDIPVTATLVTAIAINSLRPRDFYSKPDSGMDVERASYVFQLLIGRKFSDRFSLQIMPTFLHADNISFLHKEHNIFAIGIGARHKISKRISLNGEYYYQLPDGKAPGAHNVLSFGIDIGTGGHVFQLHFTNSTGLTEKSFITETKGRWDHGDVLFGFNISRVFQLKKSSTNSWKK